MLQTSQPENKKRAMTREEGYYWTRMGDVWNISYYGESWRGRNQWAWAGHELWYDDDVFYEIDERRITRIEPYPPEYWKACEELDNAVKAFFLKQGLPIPDHYDKGRT